MNAAADRLHDHRCDDVARDRRERLHLEQQHQDRRHQRAAAHPGEAHHEPDEETGQSNREIHRDPDLASNPIEVVGNLWVDVNRWKLLS